MQSKDVGIEAELHYIASS